MYNGNIDLKAIWQLQSIRQPNVTEWKTKLGNYKNSLLIRTIIVNALLGLTIALIMIIWFKAKPQFITTSIGISLMILAMVIFIFSNNKLIPLYKKLDATQSNHDYLEKLNVIKNRQKYIQKTILSVYFILLLLGICLFMYEYTLKMTNLGQVIAYTLTLLWIAISWFYIRPKTIKKQDAKLNLIISNIENIKQQLISD